MRRSHLVVIAAALAMLALPPRAAAKEVSEVRVCGSHQCTTYDRSDFKQLMFLAQDAGPTDAPTAPAPWYRVRFTVDEREHGGGFERWTVAYVPSSDRLRVGAEGGEFTWVALNPRAAAALERAARTLRALPAARLIGLPAAPAARAAATSEPSPPWGSIAVALGAALLLAALWRRSRGATPRSTHATSMRS